jgi:hypothetical protein
VERKIRCRPIEQLAGREIDPQAMDLNFTPIRSASATSRCNVDCNHHLQIEFFGQTVGIDQQGL